MAQLSFASKNAHIWDQPVDVKMAQALEWLRENPDEKPTTTARLRYIKNKRSVQRAWRHNRKQLQEVGKPGRDGYDKILRPDQRQAIEILPIKWVLI